MKRFVLPVSMLVLMIFVSAVLIVVEGIVYDNTNMWRGNVTPTGIGHAKDGTPTLDFFYNGQHHSFTMNPEIVLRFSQNSLPWLWCDIQRSERAICYPPRQPEKGTK
jgi:hypothetical protein